MNERIQALEAEVAKLGVQAEEHLKLIDMLSRNLNDMSKNVEGISDCLRVVTSILERR